jgi:hypothetical protein
MNFSCGHILLERKLLLINFILNTLAKKREKEEEEEEEEKYIEFHHMTHCFMEMVWNGMIGW